MNHWLLFVSFFIILLVAVSSQRFQERLEVQLSECIENHDSMNYFRNKVGNETITKIAKFCAKILSSNWEPFQPKDLNEIIDLLVKKKFYRNIQPPVFWVLLIPSIEKTLVECLEKDDYIDRCQESNHTAQRCDLPRFTEYEAPELAEAINYILVDWPETLDVMISSREGRSLLRRYAEDAQRALECALNLCNNNSYFFRAIVRTLWKLRAQKFFNYKNSKYPYIYHRYTMTDRTPHTCGCATSIFLSQFIPENENERDPSASLQELNRILNLHIADRPGYYPDDDNFASYQRFGMHVSQYYLETHIDQFYRIWFFSEELRRRNISTDQDDTYNGTLPFDLVPENIQAIVYDQNAYSEYLLNLRIHLEANITDIENIILQNLRETARPYEEDMFLLMNIPSTSGVISTTTSSTTETSSELSTTISSISSTTEEILDKKGKKGTLYINHCRRHFTNQSPSTMFPNKCCECDNDKKELNSDDLYNKFVVNSCLKNQHNYTVTNSGDPVFSVCSIICKNYRRKSKKTLLKENIKNYHKYNNTRTKDAYQELYYLLSDESLIFEKSLSSVMPSW